MHEFGFINRLDDVFVYREPLLHGRSAVNVIEPLDGDFTPLLRDHTPSP